jgi:hypothetical protein
MAGQISLRGQRNRKPKDGTVRQIWRCSKAPMVRFNDRAADRKPHAHAVGVGGEQGLKHPVDNSCIQPGPCIFDGYDNLLAVKRLRRNLQDTWPVGHGAHCETTSGSLSQDPVRRACSRQLRGLLQACLSARRRWHDFETGRCALPERPDQGLIEDEPPVSIVDLCSDRVLLARSSSIGRAAIARWYSQNCQSRYCFMVRAEQI